MEAVKVIFTDLLPEGKQQLPRDKVLLFLGILYDVFEMEQFEMLYMKTKPETVQEWWDILDNVELLTWDVFTKKGARIISSLPGEKDKIHIEKDANGKYKMVEGNTAIRLNPNVFKHAPTQGIELGMNMKQKPKEEFIPTELVLTMFRPYIATVNELAAKSEEPTAPTASAFSSCKPAVVTWINHIISVKNHSIADYDNGLKDGLALIHLLEVLGGSDLKGYIVRPANFADKYKNIFLALDLAAHFNIDTSPVTVNPEDIYNAHFHKSAVLIYKIAEKWSDKYNEPSSHHKSKSSAPLSQATQVELKLDQKKQDEVYRLASLAQHAENFLVIDMGPQGKEEFPWMATKQLSEILQVVCRNHMIQEMETYIATTLDGTELNVDSLLRDIPKHIKFVPEESVKGSLASLILASDRRTQRRLQSLASGSQRNYNEEDEDEKASKRREIERANAFDRTIDENVSNIALENMRKEYQKLMETLQLDKIKEEHRTKSKPKAVSSIQDVDLRSLDKVTASLESFQGSYGHSEVADKFFAGLL